LVGLLAIHYFMSQADTALVMVRMAQILTVATKWQAREEDSLLREIVILPTLSAESLQMA
jgi:hypothetical protein